MAFTETKKFLTIAGDKIFGCYRLTGDGADTTWTAPVTALEAAWFQRIDDTATDEKMSISGAVVTFGTAPANTKYVDVFFVGY